MIIEKTLIKFRVSNFFQLPRLENSTPMPNLIPTKIWATAGIKGGNTGAFTPDKTKIAVPTTGTIS